MCELCGVDTCSTLPGDDELLVQALPVRTAQRSEHVRIEEDEE